MPFVSFSEIEEWCKKQKELGYDKINIENIEQVLLEDIVEPKAKPEPVPTDEFIKPQPGVDLHGYTEEEFVDKFCNIRGKQIKQVICAGFTKTGCKCKKHALSGSKVCRHHND